MGEIHDNRARAIAPIGDLPGGLDGLLDLETQGGRDFGLAVQPGQNGGGMTQHRFDRMIR